MSILKKKTETAVSANPAVKPPKHKYTKVNFFEFLCVVPALLVIIVLNHYPLVELIRYSFTDWNLLKLDYDYVGWKNWQWFFTTLDTNGIINSFVVTLKYTVVHLILIIGLGFLMALLFNRMTKLFGFMRSIIFMPHYIAMTSAAVIFIWLFNENYGVFNYMLEAVGLKGIDWLSSATWAIWSITLVASWKGVGYDMLIYLSAMQGISKDYYEASSLDGASKLQQVRYITIPMLAPTTAYLMVTQFIGSMKIYNIVDVMTSGGPNHSTEVLVYKLYQMTFEQYRIDRAAVVSILFFIFLLIVTAVTMRWSDRKTNYDA